MPSFRQLISHLRSGRSEAVPVVARQRKEGVPERRVADRRRNIASLQEREMRLNFAVKAAKLGIFDMDCASGTIHWSPELKAIAGLPQDEAPVSLGQIKALVHPDDRERVFAKLTAAMDSEENPDFEDEHRLLRPDGTIRWVKTRGRTFFIGIKSERHASNATGVVIDITESRMYQEQLADSRARLAALIDSTTDAIISLDMEQRIVFLNPAACRMFGYREEDLLGTPHERLIPERFRESHRAHIRDFLAKGESFPAMGPPGNFFGLRASGEEFPVENTISRVQNGGEWQITTIIRDVSERKAAEEALQRSREDLELAVRNANIGIWRWDMRTGDMAWSPRCRELFGIPLDATMTFELFLGALHPDERELATATVSRALKRREEYNLEHRIHWPDGSQHWVAVVGRGHYDETSGEVIGMSGIALDVSARKEIEQNLRESEELRRLANEAANIGTYDSDLETGRRQFSPELLAILGLPPGAMLDFERGMGLVHPDDRQMMLAAYQHAMDPARDGVLRLEVRIVRGDGRVRWLAWRGRTIFRDTPEGRRPARNIGAVFDITERKHLEEELQEMNEVLERRVEERTREISSVNEELVRSNLELQQFAYVAAHDLQTPLRSISGFAQLLQKEYEGRLGEQADVWIRQVVHHVERMHHLINDLLVYSGMDSFGRPLEPTDFNQIFDEVLNSSQPAIRDIGAVITRDDLPTVLGNRIQLAQVMHNLIDNGIKYRGQIPPRIHVSARRQEQDWVLSVRDNGIGIAKKHQERVFEVFRRLHSQQAYPGTGIGLAICRRVVQRHGGRIWIESEPGKGSTFYFSLPVM